MKKLINIKELSVYLDVKPSTIYGWTSTRQIPFYKISKLIRFNIDEIDKWLENKKRKVYKYESISL